MHVSFDTEQTMTLREIVEDALKQMRVESARTDSHDYREMLHHRENVLESVLVKLASQVS